MDAERGAELLLRRGQRDHRVTRRGPDPLARPVGQHDRADRRHRGADGDEQQLADRREPVARRRDLLVPLPAVADEAAGEPDDRRRAVVEAVDDPEGERREVADVDEVERQHRHDHLRRDVREQAREPEQHHGPADAGPRLPARQQSAVAAQEGGRSGDLVHG